FKLYPQAHDSSQIVRSVTFFTPLSSPAHGLRPAPDRDRDGGQDCAGGVAPAGCPRPAAWRDLPSTPATAASVHRRGGAGRRGAAGPRGSAGRGQGKGGGAGR